MKLLGNISHLANSGKLIATSTKTPPSGAFVYTADKKKIGKVFTIFGPVKNPYVSINLYKSVNKRDLESRAGEKLFASTKREIKKDSKNSKKNFKKNSNKKSNKKRNKSKKNNKNKNYSNTKKSKKNSNKTSIRNKRRRN